MTLPHKHEYNLFGYSESSVIPSHRRARIQCKSRWIDPSASGRGGDGRRYIRSG
jgi:hypothetical protein